MTASPSSDAEIILNILRRFMREEYWDFNTPATLSFLKRRNCLVLDGTIFDLSDDEVAALERFTGESLA